jgi:glycosyltransferase involved in cell wall biosynthesis
MNDNSYDVTISVWNDFHSPELCEGLSRNGFSVLALRSEKRPLENTETRHSETSRVLTRLFQRTQFPFLLEAAQNSFESFALRNLPESKVFWGWNGHNLKPFESAKKCTQKNVCERGSTHAAWAFKRLAKVHNDLGWGFENYIQLSPRDNKSLKEYEIADRIMVPSNFVFKTFLEEGFDSSKLHINPYGVDLNLWNSVNGSHRKFGPLVFIYTASVIPRKGAHILFRAWEAAALRDAELWISGSIHMPLDRLGIRIGKNVKFLGFKTHVHLTEIYNTASVYVLPSFEEGMARSGIEALASGLPVIVTEETGLTDLMKTGREGWIVNSGSVEHLAETFRQVGENRNELVPRSKAARECTRNSSKENYGNRAASFLKEFLRN